MFINIKNNELGILGQLLLTHRIFLLVLKQLTYPLEFILYMNTSYLGMFGTEIMDNILALQTPLQHTTAG